MMSSVFINLRRTHFSRLDEEKHIYLDYAGSALYPSTLLEHHFQQLQRSVLGHPHSSGPTSQLSSRLVELTRQKILSFFNADPMKYDVIFTANVTAAVKLVAESFPFSKSSQLLLLADNHNSVNGIREYARRASSLVRYIRLLDNMRAEDPSLYLSDARTNRGKTSACNLFAFPAQSNFSGVKHPLSWIEEARYRGWYVLLDATSFLGSGVLDLSQINPHFITVSFYHMFGYPTGVSALLARKSGSSVLRRPWFSGGSARFVSTLDDNLVLPACMPHAFEDGTVDFTNVPAVTLGLEFLESISMRAIHAHVMSLTRQLLSSLMAMRWRNGEPIIHIYGPDDTIMRGGTVAFDIIYMDGRRVDARRLQHAAQGARISLRVGSFGNPGAMESALSLDARSLRSCFQKVASNFSVQQMSRCVGLGFLGCARISVGLANTELDVRKFIIFLTDFCVTLEKDWGLRSGFSIDSDGVANRNNTKRWRDAWSSGRLKVQPLKWISGSRHRLSLRSQDNSVRKSAWSF